MLSARSRSTSIHLDTAYPGGLAPVSDPKYGLILAAIARVDLICCLYKLRDTFYRLFNETCEGGCDS